MAELVLDTIDPAKMHVYRPTCGIKKDLYKKYNFEDHVWANPTSVLPEDVADAYSDLFDSLLKFAHYCVLIEDKYWLKTPNGIWIEKSSKTFAEKDTINLYNSKQIGAYKYDDYFCQLYFSGELKITDIDKRTGKQQSVSYHIGSCPQLDGTIMIPFGPEFVVVDDVRYLNTWRDSSVKGDEQHKNYGKEFLRLFYRSLCDGAELHSDAETEMNMIEQEVLRGTYCGNRDFKFLMMYIAAIYQKPGVNLLTNLWLLGSLEGVGKGTLIKLLSRCVGQKFVGRLDQSEIERGWEDHIKNKILIEVNELELTTSSGSGGKTKKWWNQWIKKKTIEEIVTYTERGRTPHTTINIANYIFTTNDENPIDLGSTDRRNQFIKTTADPQWVHVAAAINQQLFNLEAEACTSGFAYYLERVRVDWQYVNISYLNDMKIKVITNSGSVIDEWLDNDVTFDHRKTLATPALISDLYVDYFIPWVRQFSPIHQNTTLKMFGVLLRQSHKYDTSSKRVTSGVVVSIAPKNNKNILQNRDELMSIIASRHNKVAYLVKDDTIPDTHIDRSKVSKLQLLRAQLAKMTFEDDDK